MTLTVDTPTDPEFSFAPDVAVDESAPTSATGALRWSELVGAGRISTIDRLPDRDLANAELVELVSSIAANSEQWERHVAFSDHQRHYAHCTEMRTSTSGYCAGRRENDAGWHDHDISCGAVAATRGRLVEHNLAIGRESAQTDVSAGFVFSFGADHIHRLTGGDPGTVSIHAYSPPLWRMGQYSVAGGVLRRQSVSYADELRPLDEAL